MHQLQSLVNDLVAEAVRQLDFPQLLKEQPICYSAEEAADMLKCKQTTILDAFRNGELRGSKVGKKATFTRESLEAFHETREVL